MKSVWLNDWEDAGVSQLEQHFGLKTGSLQDIEILLASYKESDDSGYAFVLYRHQQCLYEVNASHDSVLDFRDQWQPEETTVEALIYRLNKGNLGSSEASENVFAEPLYNVLRQLMQ